MRKKLVVASIVLLAALTAALFVIAIGSGQTIRPPYAISIGHHQVCLPMRYRLTKLDPSYGLTREETLTVLREAADIWNGAADCRLLTYHPQGELRIALYASNRAERALMLGCYDLLRHEIRTYDSDRFSLLGLVAHEMGHALGLDHVTRGLMQPIGNWFLTNEPHLNDADLAEMRRQYWFLHVRRPTPTTVLPVQQQ